MQKFGQFKEKVVLSDWGLYSTDRTFSSSTVRLFWRQRNLDVKVSSKNSVRLVCLGEPGLSSRVLETLKMSLSV